MNWRYASDVRDLLSRQVQEERVRNGFVGGSQTMQNIHKKKGNARFSRIVT